MQLNLYIHTQHIQTWDTVYLTAVFRHHFLRASWIYRHELNKRWQPHPSIGWTATQPERRWTKTRRMWSMAMSHPNLMIKYLHQQTNNTTYAPRQTDGRECLQYVCADVIFTVHVTESYEAVSFFAGYTKLTWTTGRIGRIIYSNVTLKKKWWNCWCLGYMKKTCSNKCDIDYFKSDRCLTFPHG